MSLSPVPLRNNTFRTCGWFSNASLHMALSSIRTSASLASTNRIFLATISTNTVSTGFPRKFRSFEIFPTPMSAPVAPVHWPRELLSPFSPSLCQPDTMFFSLPPNQSLSQSTGMITPWPTSVPQRKPRTISLSSTILQLLPPHVS